MNKLDSEPLSPIEAKSLKDAFIERFESLILSGRFATGEKVPSERDLAEMFGISRPVVHEGLRALENRGLVTIESRKGVRVNDYRREGSIEMLLSILNYSGGKLSPDLLDGILEMRHVFETDIARRAAERRTPEQLAALEAIINAEKSSKSPTGKAMMELDFAFHHAVALASGNAIYPLLLNSFKTAYKTILEIFYTDKSVFIPVFQGHAKVTAAIASGKPNAAADAMKELLEYGEDQLRKTMGKKKKAIDGKKKA